MQFLFNIFLVSSLFFTTITSPSIGLVEKTKKPRKGQAERKKGAEDREDKEVREDKEIRKAKKDGPLEEVNLASKLPKLQEGPQPEKYQESGQNIICKMLASKG